MNYYSCAAMEPYLDGLFPRNYAFYVVLESQCAMSAIHHLERRLKRHTFQ